MRAELPWAGAFLGVAGLVAAPLLVYFALHPEDFFLRSQHLWVFDPVRSQGNPLGAFLFNVWDHLLVLGFRGDPSWWRNYAGQPMLEPHGKRSFSGLAWVWSCGAGKGGPPIVCSFSGWRVLILPAMLALDNILPQHLYA